MRSRLDREDRGGDPCSAQGLDLAQDKGLRELGESPQDVEEARFLRNDGLFGWGKTRFVDTLFPPKDILRH